MSYFTHFTLRTLCLLYVCRSTYVDLRTYLYVPYIVYVSEYVYYIYIYKYTYKFFCKKKVGQRCIVSPISKIMRYSVCYFSSGTQTRTPFLSFNTDSYYNRRNCSMKTCLILIPTATVDTSTVTVVQRDEVVKYRERGCSGLHIRGKLVKPNTS